METLAALLDLRDRRLRHQGESGGRAVGEQQVDDLLRGAVAEELAERLLVPGDAGRVDPRDEILLGVALQRRDTEARVLRQKVRRRAVQVGEVAAPAAGDADLLRRPGGLDRKSTSLDSRH